MNTEQIIFLITVVALIFLIIKKKQAGRIKYIESHLLPASLKHADDIDCVFACGGD